MEIDLTQSHPEGRLPQWPTPSILEQRIEQLFITWNELDDDRARKLALRTLIGSEAELRSVLLALVPLYFDPFYFDEKTPTHDLVEIALVAHRKWRTWRARSRS